MTLSVAVPFSGINSGFALAATLLVPFAIAGVALINTGLSRSRNAAHSITASLFIVATAALTYAVVGCAWIGFSERPAYVINIAGRSWSWIASERFLLRGLAPDGSAASLSACLQMFTVALAALIPLGGAAERWRLTAGCASTVLFAGLTYPLYAHWAWGGGWLAQLGAYCGLGRGYLDAGGSGSIHAVGGLTALALAWILGPRRGKYTPEGMPAAMPGHNGVIVILGCMLAWVGWLGLNSAGAILYSAADYARAPLIALNTTLAASASALITAITTRSRFGRPDASLCANGWICGLVAGSAGCASMAPAAAIATGMIAGVLVSFSIELLELHLGLDDPGGAISVHALGGIWGLLAAGVFSSVTYQWLAQCVGIASLLGFVFPLTYALNWLLDRLRPQRVAPEGERQGMDLHELGAGAYPEFATHTPDFMQ